MHGVRVFKDPERNNVKLFVVNYQNFQSPGNFSLMYKANISRLSDDGSPKEQPYEVVMKRILIARTQLVCFREVYILRTLAIHHPHKNIVKLLFTQRKNFNTEVLAYYMVFRFMPKTLAGLRQQLNEERNVLDIKLYIWQLFSGLNHLKKLHIIHRDVKPANILVDPGTGRLEIADFGSAMIRSRDPSRCQGKYAITRPYRPPELLLKAKRYNWMADVWSAGCIFAELFIGQHLFFAESGAKQLQLIYEFLGTPSADELKAMNVAERQFVPTEEQRVVWPQAELASRLTPMGYNGSPEGPAPLIIKILKFNPAERLNGRALLDDPFFQELFEAGRRRRNGALVSAAIDEEDRLLNFGTTV